jgi:hypothetical protein
LQVDRIDTDDPLILAVTQQEFDALKNAYVPLAASFVDAGDGIMLIEIQHNVVAPFRIARVQ